MAKKPTRKKRRARRQYGDDLKAEAVQMLLDGHTAKSIAENLGVVQACFTVGMPV